MPSFPIESTYAPVKLSYLYVLNCAYLSTPKLVSETEYLPLKKSYLKTKLSTDNFDYSYYHNRNHCYL